MTDRPTVWERDEPAARPAPSPLSRERIVRAAVELADAEGLEAVSLRRVAGLLGSGPMRLYRYIDTKDELLELLVDTVYREIPVPTGQDWSAVLRSVADGLRDAARRHEWFAELLDGRPRLGPGQLAHTEAVLAALHATPGFEDMATVAWVYEVFAVYLTGAVRKEIAERRNERDSGLDEQQWQHSEGPFLTRMLATGDYPTLERFVNDAPYLDAPQVFALGLDCLLAGVARRAGLPEPSPT